MTVNEIPTRPRTYKRPWLAALLNLVPLLGLAGCAANGINHTSDAGPICFAGVIWGLGYLYLGRGFRFLLALALPWVLGLVACALSRLRFRASPIPRTSL